MRYLQTKVNTVFTKLSDEVVREVVREVYYILVSFKELEEIVSEETMANFNEDIAYKQLDVIEAVSYEIKYDALTEFKETLSAHSGSLLRRVDAGHHYLVIADKLLQEISRPFIPMTTEQVLKVREVCEKVLGELSYFLYYQFNIDIAAETFTREEEEFTIDISVHKFLTSEMISFSDFIKTLSDIMDKFRPEFTIFEEFPELEVEFYNICGAYIKDFEAISEHVTVDVVKRVLEGKEDVEDIVKELESRIESGD